MLKKYDVKIKKILSTKSWGIDWEEVLENHNEMIAVIQHERLIHLLVTIFVGLVMSMSSFVTIITREFYMIFLDIPLLGLFLGYLFHYRFLENTTQSWYRIKNVIKKRL